MKAIIYEKYGSPDVLALQEVEKPTLTDDGVLVNIEAASANPLDWHSMRADPFLVRLGGGLLKPKNNRLGADVAGWVETVGRNVTRFQPGDAVYGEIGTGAFAEYVCVSERKLVKKPANLSFEAAAAVPVAALTALQGLRDHGQIQSGQRVLINGASGGVGTYAVQIAKSYGAEVTAVCSSRNLELVRSIGADHVIDYTQEDFAQNGQQYDLILDNVGNRSVSEYKRALRPNGICVVIGFSTFLCMLQVVVQGLWESRFGSKKITLMLAKMNVKDMQFLNELLETGQVVSVIDRSYPLSETAEAIRYLETGRARGKVVISLEQNNKN